MDDKRPTCFCGEPVPPGKQKYCAEHSREASAIWKRRERRLRRRDRPWLDPWRAETGDDESARQAYNAYVRERMREHRARRREASR